MDTTTIDLLSQAVAECSEVITDDTVLTERGHDFWGFGAWTGTNGWRGWIRISRS